MKKPLLAIALLLGLAVTMLVAPAAYAFDIPPLNIRFDTTLSSWSVALGSNHVSWSSAHLKGTLSLTTSLATITFQSGSAITNLAVRGSMNVTLTGTHSFTGIIKIHLDGSDPPIEIVDLKVS